MNDYGKRIKYVKETLGLRKEDIKRHFTESPGFPIELRGRPTTGKTVVDLGIELLTLPSGWTRQQLYGPVKNELIGLLGVTDKSTIGLKWETVDDHQSLWLVKLLPKAAIFEDPLKRNLSMYEKSTIPFVLGGQYIFMPAETDEHLEFIKYHSHQQLVPPNMIHLVERDKEVVRKLEDRWGKEYKIHNEELSDYISQTHIPVGYLHADYQVALSEPHLKLLEILATKTSPVSHFRFTHMHFDGVFGPQKSSAMNTIVRLRKQSMLELGMMLDQESKEGLNVIYKDLLIEDCLAAAPTIWAYLTYSYLKLGTPHCVWPSRVVKYKLANSRWMETVWFTVMRMSEDHTPPKIILESMDQLIFASRIAYDISCFSNVNVQSIERKYNNNVKVN